MGLRDVELQRPEVGGDLWRLEVLLELSPSKASRPVLVSLFEEGRHLPRVGLQLAHLVLYQEVAVPGGDLRSGGHKGAHDNIHDTDGHEEDVEVEDGLVHPRDLDQWPDCILPIDATRDCHEERHHGPQHAPVQFSDAFHLILGHQVEIRKMLRNTVEEEDGKHVDYQEHDNEAPSERQHRLEDREDHYPEAVKGPQCSRYSDDPKEAHEAKDSACRDIGHGAKAINGVQGCVDERQHHQHGVEKVPLPLRPDKEEPALSKEPQQQL
mmetsp:Transcript_3233/g.7509  ORF Transcript_3233/g.7509 Transcript_3233/m.7509 type:complete len:267 (+) Transcript_3233:394-1194(+)